MQVYAEPLVNKNIKSESVGVGGWDWWSAEARFPSSSSSPTSLCPGCLLSPLRRNWHASPKLRGSVSSLLPKPSNLITGNRALFEEEKKNGAGGWGPSDAASTGGQVVPTRAPRHRLSPASPCWSRSDSQHKLFSSRGTECGLGPRSRGHALLRWKKEANALVTSRTPVTPWAARGL